ncbi:ribonuclease Y [candidate division KSB1 bacterium]|nr:ribonuclease Y [candidate division KSB1 bacterium]
MDNIFYLIITASVSVVMFFLGWVLSTKLGQGKVASAEKLAEKIVSEAEKEASSIRNQKLIEAKDEMLRLKNNFDNETKNQRQESDKAKRELEQREREQDKRLEHLNQKENELKRIEQSIKDRVEHVQKKQEDLDNIIAVQNEKLERISGMSNEEAMKELKQNLLYKAKQLAAQEMKDIRDQARLTANKEAKEIIISSIQRTAADHSAEATVSVVHLPGDDMKGRIIGREGRNIRAFENATGIDVIVDDTPEAVILSGFDPYRREIARRALETLIIDGRIHPARIEEIVEKKKIEMEEAIVELGEQAMLETGVHGLHPELVKQLGKLNFRTSYGQNVLQHSIEMAYLAGLMASALQLDAVLAKRAALLHDIGKSIDRNTEGTHFQLGMEMAKRYGEGPVILNAIEAHHGEVEMTSPISALVQAADAISGSRPGARRETLEGYIKRLEKLETIAESFEGVSKTYAIQAGREVRVLVQPESINDAQSDQLAADIAERIQQEMEYPGQIKVMVIREYRSIDYAK